MKRFMKASFIALVIGALASISAFAGDKGDKGKTEKRTVTIAQDVTVNGTLLKAGDYEVKFDDATGQLSILQNGKLKVKTAAHIEARTDKARDTSLRTVQKDGTVELIGVTFGGTSRNVMVGSSGTMSGTQ